MTINIYLLMQKRPRALLKLICLLITFALILWLWKVWSKEAHTCQVLRIKWKIKLKEEISSDLAMLCQSVFRLTFNFYHACSISVIYQATSFYKELYQRSSCSWKHCRNVRNNSIPQKNKLLKKLNIHL